MWTGGTIWRRRPWVGITSRGLPCPPWTSGTSWPTKSARRAARQRYCQAPLAPGGITVLCRTQRATRPGSTGCQVVRRWSCTATFLSRSKRTPRQCKCMAGILQPPTAVATLFCQTSRQGTPGLLLLDHDTRDGAEAVISPDPNGVDNVGVGVAGDDDDTATSRRHRSRRPQDMLGRAIGWSGWWWWWW